MLTLHNEPDDGQAITLSRVHDVEARAAAIPAGELVRIIGLAVDGDDVALWSISWHGNAYWCGAEELRPDRVHELQETFTCEDGRRVH